MIGSGWLRWFPFLERRTPRPFHLTQGISGETAARKYLQKTGLKFLTANYRAPPGEIDLIFRDGECLVFVEVKSRTPGGWVRPAGAVNKRKQRLLTLSALDYLRKIKNPEVKLRFDIVEVLLDCGKVQQIRHLPNSFSLHPPYRYG